MPNTPDPKTMFATAEQCFFASKILATDMLNAQDNTKHLVPCATLEAFALELYLKTLAVTEGKLLLKTHNLYKLFTNLSATTQTEIKERSAIHITTVGKQYNRPADFDQELKNSQDAFEVTRYIYERVPAYQGWTLSGVTRETRALIIHRHPTWEGATLNLPPGILDLRRCTCVRIQTDDSVIRSIATEH